MMEVIRWMPVLLLAGCGQAQSVSEYERQQREAAAAANEDGEQARAEPPAASTSDTQPSH